MCPSSILGGEIGPSWHTTQVFLISLVGMPQRSRTGGGIFLGEKLQNLELEGVHEVNPSLCLGTIIGGRLSLAIELFTFDIETCVFSDFFIKIKIFV